MAGQTFSRSCVCLRFLFRVGEEKGKIQFVKKMFHSIYLSLLLFEGGCALRHWNHRWALFVAPHRISYSYLFFAFHYASSTFSYLSSNFLFSAEIFRFQDPLSSSRSVFFFFLKKLDFNHDLKY